MKKGKKLISALVMMVIIFASILPSYALPVFSTLQERAQLLDTLSILTGSSEGYRLDEKLNRSEAAAFAVRIMGKELHVLLNAAAYKKTAFPDVEASAWYASYVGFCTQEGIIAGDSKGNFNPAGYITEKAFLKIILGVLGYKINTDYTWDNVYKKAYEAGLVTELNYIVRTEDNLEFKRSNAVNILYNALTLKSQSTQKELFYGLIESGVVTEKEAIEAGLMKASAADEVEIIPEVKDEVQTEIKKVHVINSTSMSFQFTEEIKKIESIRVYEAANSSNLLKHEIDVQEAEYLFLKTDPQSPGKEYLVELTGIEDMQGNVLESLYGVFSGHLPEKVESNFLRIQKIKPVNESSILLFFTHPININVENASHYTIFEGSSIIAEGEKDQILARVYSSETNCVMLSLKNDKFSENKEYIVEIDGKMTSAYGVRMNDAKGDRMGFTAVSGKAEPFKLNEIISYNASTLMLVFNKEINPFLAQQIYNFYLTDEDENPVTLEKTTMMEKIYLMAGETLFISTKNELKRDGKYYLTINNLNDVSRQEYITESVYSFTANFSSSERLKIERINAVSNQKIEIYFTNSLDQTTAENAENYAITYRYDSKKISPAGIIYNANDDPTKVVLFFSDTDKLVGNREYELTVNGNFRDYVGTTIDETIRKSFKASTNSRNSPYIDEAVAISSDAVKLVFTDPVAFDRTNLSVDNYTLEYTSSATSIKKIPLSVLYADATTLILKFDELEYDTSYKLKFNTIMDYAGSSFKVSGEGTNYIEFEVKGE